MSKSTKNVSKRNGKRAVRERTLPQINHGRHCVHQMHVHLVFVTKYRLPVFDGAMLSNIHLSAYEVCKELGAELVSFEGETNHVHLLVNYEPKLSVSKLVNSLKGVTSRKLKQAFKRELKGKIWNNKLWSPSYFGASCGGAPLEIIKEYIAGQNRPA